MEGIVNMCMLRSKSCMSFASAVCKSRTLLLQKRFSAASVNQHSCTLRSFCIDNSYRPSTGSACRSIVRRSYGCFRRQSFPEAGFYTHRCFMLSDYSTKTSPGSVTDDLLKAKLQLSKPSSSPAEGPSQEGESNAESGKKTSGKSESSWFSSKNAWKLGLLLLGGSAILMCGNVIFLWGQPKRDDDGFEIKDEFSNLPTWQAYPRRAMKEVKFFTQMIQDPSSEKLLPDPLKEPWYQPPYTLVLEMTGVLVHPDWTLNTGWRFKKRPGLDYFLQQIGPPLFEVVIYTHEQGFTAFPIIDGLDPHGHVMFRLFRDATRYVDGTHVKDLGCLNRDLSKVIIVDCDPKAFSLQPQNAFLLKKWTGDDGDRTLVDVAAFLRTIAMSEVEDVRPVLEYYSQFDDPIAVFKEKQRQVQEQQEHQSSMNKTQKSSAGKYAFGLTGLKRG